MNLSQWPIFKAGLFKQAKYLVSSPLRSQDALAILETGSVGIEPMPISTGFLTTQNKEIRKAWASVHSLKVQIYKDGVPTGKSGAIPISERCYIPLDPLSILKAKEREKLASLDDIAVSRHDDALADTTPNTQMTMQKLIIQYGFMFLGFLLVIYLVKGC